MRGTRSYKDLRLLRSEVPLHAGVSVCVEGDLDDTFLHRLHRLHLLGVVSGHRRAAEPRRLTDKEHTRWSHPQAGHTWNRKSPSHLTVEPVKRHRGVRQADHPHPGGGDVRQRSLVFAFPLLLLALGLPVSALSLETRGEPSSQEVLSLRVQRPRGVAPKRLDASRQQHLRAADGPTGQEAEQHGRWS